MVIAPVEVSDDINRTFVKLIRCSKPVGAVGVLFGTMVIVVQTLPGTRPVIGRVLYNLDLIVANGCVSKFAQLESRGSRWDMRYQLCDLEMLR